MSSLFFGKIKKFLVYTPHFTLGFLCYTTGKKLPLPMALRRCGSFLIPEFSVNLWHFCSAGTLFWLEFVPIGYTVFTGAEYAGKQFGAHIQLTPSFLERQPLICILPNS